MRESIESAFPRSIANICLQEIEELEFSILDNEPAIIVSNQEDDWHFVVQNPEKRKIAFLAIDKCLFFDEEDKGVGRCDFSLFDEAYFLFVEVKKDHTNTTRDSRRREAFKQLCDTFDTFAEKIQLLEQYKVIGVICLAGKIPRPTKRKGSDVRQLKWEEKGGASVLESNSFEFSTTFLQKFHD